MIRFEQVNREIIDDDMTEMLRNNPPDVVYTAFSQAFFQGAIRMFQRDNEMRNIVLSDPRRANRPSGISSGGRFARCGKTLIPRKAAFACFGQEPVHATTAIGSDDDDDDMKRKLVGKTA